MKVVILSNVRGIPFPSSSASSASATCSTHAAFYRKPTSFSFLGSTVTNPRVRVQSRLSSPWRGISRTTFPKILALSSNDIKVGSNIEVDGAPWRVMEFLHVKPGKGAAFVRTKLRNYVTGNTVEKTFRAGASSTYEESRLGELELGDKQKWLKEGIECNVLSWNGRIIDVELPISVKYRVVEAEVGEKGDTVQGASKPAKLDTGAVVNVPLFVNEGDEIVVDTRTGTYMSRV